MFCEKCGTKLEEGELFCPNCGERVVPEEESKTEEPVEQAAPEAEDTNNAEDTVKPEEPAKAQEPEEPAKPEKTKSGKRPLIIGLAAAAAVLVLFACVAVMVGVLGLAGRKDTLIYLKDNEILELSSKDSIVIGDRTYTYKDDISNTNLPSVTLSEDGRYIYYPQKINGSSYDLYRRPVGRKKAEEVKIASGVSSYVLLKDGRVVYLSSERLYIYNPKKDDKEKVASDVAWMRVSEDEKQILWRSSDSNQRLYVCDTAQKQDEVKLDSDVTNLVYLSENFDRIVYRKDTDLYIMMNLEDKQKIAADVSQSFVCKDGKNVRYYYVKAEETGLNYMDFVDDDLAAQDAGITEPDSANYQHEELVEDWWGNLRPQTVTDWDAYYADRDAYYDKQQRDRLRESLKENTVSVQKRTIYEYLPDKDESNAIYEGYISDIYSGSYAAFLYGSFDLDNIDKAAFSKLADGTVSIYEYVEKATAEAAKLNMVYDGKSVELQIDFEDLFGENSLDDVRLRGTSNDAKQCYFCLSSYSEGNVLCKSSLSKMDGAVEIVAEEVGNVVFVTDAGAYYVIEDEDMVGDLYFEDKKLDSDVSVSSLLKMKNDKGILYMTDMAKEKTVGTLKWYNGSKSIKISDDVSAYRSNKKGDIAFLTDYNFNRYRGDLKLYRNNKIKELDDDVTGILLFD